MVIKIKNIKHSTPGAIPIIAAIVTTTTIAIGKINSPSFTPYLLNNLLEK